MADRVASIFYLTCATGALMLGGFTGVAYAQEADDRAIEEVVITAERRETNLQSTPVAVTALTGDALEGNRVHSVGDLNNLAPGLQVVVSGTTNTAIFNLRGVNSTGFFPGQSSGVTTYIDGIAQSGAAGTVFDLAEIERIEVLRGPQGTLFGRNANGGAVSFTTRLPSGELSVHQELTAGNFAQFRSKTRVDLPQWGPISASATYLHDEREGDTDNLGAGTQWDWGPVTQGLWGIRTSPDRMGDRETDAFAVTLRFQPSDQFDVIYRYDQHDLTYTDAATAVYGDPNNLASAFPFGVPAVYNTIPADIRTPVTLTRPDAVNNYFVTPVWQDGIGHSITATLEANDFLTFRNITSYREVAIAVNSQLDAARGGAPVIPGTPFLVQGSGSWNDNQTFTTEFQAFVTLDFMDLTTGVFYYEGTVNNGPRINPGSCASGACFSDTATQPYVISQLGQLRSDVRSESTAIYAQANVHLTSNLDLQIGARHTMDHSVGVDNLSGVTFPIVYDDEHNTWLLGLNYQVTDDVFLYAKASTGFISGGSLSGFDYEPEEATSYEIGAKADLFARRLRTNVAIYRSIYEGLQQSGILPGAGPGGGGLSLVWSYADAETEGVEVEATWLPPIEGLTLAGSLSYASFEYTSFNPTYLLFNGLTPGQIQESRPDWTGNFSAQYETAPMPWGGIVVARIDADYRGETNLMGSWRTQAQREVQRIDGRWIVNGRLALSDLSFSGSDVELALWVRNATDWDGPISSTFIGYNNGIFMPERTFGVDLTLDF